MANIVENKNYFLAVFCSFFRMLKPTLIICRLVYTEFLVDWFTAYYNSVARHFGTKPFRPIDVSLHGNHFAPDILLHKSKGRSKDDSAPRRFGPTRFLDLSGREVGKETFRLLDRSGGIWYGRVGDRGGMRGERRVRNERVG